MKLLVFLLMVLAGLVQCKGNKLPQEKVRTKNGSVRDTSITPEKAFTRLRVDSLQMENFLTGVGDVTAVQLRSFYNSRNYQYAWFTENGPSEHTQSYWNRLSKYIKLTKDSTLYDSVFFTQMQYILDGDTTISLRDSSTVHLELQLTKSFFSYAKQVYEGVIDPEVMQWHIPRRKIDAVALLDSLVKHNILGSASGMQNEGYKALRRALERYHSLEHATVANPFKVEEGVFRPGDSDVAIRSIKHRLALLGDLPQQDTGSVFNEELLGAVIRFQKRHGLQEDGIVGPQMLRALHVPIEKRIETLLINMERQRWLPPLHDNSQIVVNIPEFRLHIYEDGEKKFTTDIVVGKAATRTVIFADELKYIVFSPYWNIPRSIVRNEILPALKKNSGYLQRHNMEMIGSRGGLPVIRQKPGKNNALGSVKFIFPNEYSIYFHDTPAKSLFDRRQRAFSHGCIRVQKPFELAQFLLKDEKAWTPDRIRSYMGKDKEKWVTLDKAIPVAIVYLTSWVDGKGLLHFREDIYGHDQRMAERLFEHRTHPHMK